MNKKKNLLFIFADQWRADAIGYAQADPVHTPNMDAFCTDATYCDHAFSTFPVCTAHRASLITGRYPLSMGIFTRPPTSVSGIWMSRSRTTAGNPFPAHGTGTPLRRRGCVAMALTTGTPTVLTTST